MRRNNKDKDSNIYDNSSLRLKVLIIILAIIFGYFMFNLIRIQLINGKKYKRMALEQWSKSTDIKSDRGVIYDRNGKKLAVNVNGFSVWITPKKIDDALNTSKNLAKILKLDEEFVYKKINSKKDIEKLSSWIEREDAQKLEELNLKGIKLEEENKRFYPNGNLASHILGFTDIDNNGLSGVERTYDDYLSGIPGKWFRMTDADKNRQLPYDKEKIYEPKDGLSIVLTIDENIQKIAEKAAMKAYKEHNAKNVSVIVMDPRNGDILAMTNKPDYNPNKPRSPRNDYEKQLWESMNDEELGEYWNKIWRNYSINDIYEPGSTFKLITAAAALEEGTTSPEKYYRCNGFVTDIPGQKLRCARWYRPHGDITFREGMDDSCNVVFINVGRELGKEKLLKYIKGFGFGEKTYVNLLGEELGIIPNTEEDIKEVNLATISYGHGIAVTPIQLISSVSAVINGGYLLKPNIVKEVVDKRGEIVEEREPVVKKQVISEETSSLMRSLMETVVSEGSGKNAKIPGYKVGGKTGTAEKIIDKAYAKDKYIASFIGAAPMDDPQLLVLAIVDEPEVGKHYGGTAAAPIVREVLEGSLDYLNIKPTEEINENDIELLEVPDVIGHNIKDAISILSEHGYKYTILNPGNEDVVIKQEPKAKTYKEQGGVIELTLGKKEDIIAEDNNQENQDANELEENQIIIPNLIGKTREEAEQSLKDLGISYQFSTDGKVVKNQNPSPDIPYREDETLIIELE